MNRFAFNSRRQIIDQWGQLYFSQAIIDSFQTIIDETHKYLEIITNYKTKLRGGGKAKRLKSRNSLINNFDQLNQGGGASQVDQFYSDDPQPSIQRIKDWIINIDQLQNQVSKQWKLSLKEDGDSKKSNNMNVTQQTITAQEKISNFSPLQICSTHLERIAIQSFKFYNAFLHQDFKVIRDFFYMKSNKIIDKLKKIQGFFLGITQESKYFPSLRIIYDNLFIQAQYLDKFVQKNKAIFQTHSHQKEYSSGYQQINQIRHKFIQELLEFREKVQQVKAKLRFLYMTYIKKSTKAIRNHDKLEKSIICEIQGNQNSNEKGNYAISFVNGFTFAILMCALIAIVIFRQANIKQLEQDPNYLRDFKVWRGESYIICFNWVIGIAFWTCRRMRVNYRMILTEGDCCLPGPQSFFLSASVLSALYLALFLVYLLHQLGVVSGHPFISKLGYAAWAINLAFLLCPLRILNFEGRRYFLKLFGKFLASLFRPMNMNIFFVAIIVGSFVQPFADFAFTICQAAYGEERDCIKETGNATLGFTVGFLFYRCVQSIRSHIQFGDRCYSRPLIGITAVLFSLNAVISAFLYGHFLSEGLLTYWLVSAALSTLTGIQADLRADWGLISFDSEDCILRKYKTLPRSVYFAVAAVDIVLNVGWVLTVSNNTASGLGIDMVYFLMILSYIELARKGMWIVFRLEEDHSLNIAQLKATLDDSQIYQEITLVTGPLRFEFLISNQREDLQRNHQNEKDAPQQNQKEDIMIQPILNKIQDKIKDSHKSKIGQPIKIKNMSDVQRMVINKKIIRSSLLELIDQLEGYLIVVHSMYQTLDLEEAY